MVAGNGIFNAISAFNNSGMSVLDANIVPYGGSYFVLIVMGVLILAGNTAYPLFLRLWLWSLLELLRAFTPDAAYADLKQTLEYILKYPRRVYTNLFPARATWWLVFMLFVLNGTDWVGFEILNLGNPALSQIPLGPRVVDGLFQALGRLTDWDPWCLGADLLTPDSRSIGWFRGGFHIPDVYVALCATPVPPVPWKPGLQGHPPRSSC